MRRSAPLLLSLGLTAACAGGGGGGSPGAPPPIGPPSPPRPAVALTGSSIQATITADVNGVVTNMTATPITSGPTNTHMGFDPGTSAPGDETYRIQHNLGTTTIDRDFVVANSIGVSQPGWPEYRRWNQGGLTFDLFNLLSPPGTEPVPLEFTYPVRLAQGGSVMFGVFGTRAGPLPSTLPERYQNPSGDATFRGGTAGYFYDIDKRIYRVAGDLMVTANFSRGTITGRVNTTALSAETPPPTANPIPAPSGGWLNFTFNGHVNASTMVFDANAAGAGGDFGALSGEVEGMFYAGPGQAADEAGLTFLLVNTAGTVRYLGVGGANHVLAPRPYLTPMTTVATGRGPSVMVSGANVGISGARGPGSSVTGSTLLNVSPDVSGAFLPGPTSGFNDDTFSLHYAANGFNFDRTWQYGGSLPGFDGFGSGQNTIQTGPDGTFNLTHHHIGFDIGPSLAGALDHVFLVSIAGDRSSTNQTYGFVVFGNQTAAADMPTTGSATFSGQTRGVYLDSIGRFYRTASDLSLSANFSTGAVNGSTNNFRAFGDFFTEASADRLDFNFTGAIAAGTSTFSASAASAAGGLGLTGRVEGAFYGAQGQPPDEAGIAYQLGTPGGGAFMAGGGVAARN